MTWIAHIRQEGDDKIIQSVTNHLEQVANIASNNSSKLGLSKAGELLGLLHDFGKFSQAFQNYIGSATGVINQDEDEYVDSVRLKGRIDHSTAGAKFIWDRAKGQKQSTEIAAQVLSLCLASHHSGLIDCISVDGGNMFEERLNRPEERIHYSETVKKADKELITRITDLISGGEVFNTILDSLKKIALKENSQYSITAQFQCGLMARMLFSCLIDADRIDTSDFENPKNGKQRQHGQFTGWDQLISKLEQKLQTLKNRQHKNPIDEIREKVSEACKEKAKNATGVFTLTVPTGGGKTLASLRFALHHAKIHKLDRIIYIIPYTTIIEQNANLAREILEREECEYSRIVLEHHSNLVPELQNWKTKILTENWDAPIIFTTSVQFLETIFKGGTRSARRMHQLARSVIVFDEIQTLPVKTTHMFCNAINFLANHCNSSVVLCTATQPLFNKVSEVKGRISFSNRNEIMPDVKDLFRELKRVEVINGTKPSGWEITEIVQLAIEQVGEFKSCLIITNTKTKARELYESCVQLSDILVYHLSTNMCPAHRMAKLKEIRKILKLNKSIICVSTQLIEAGVDIDFGMVIRFVAGLDSIAQAAGRCNREGRRATGKVYVVNPKEENIDSLHDIKTGRDISYRILDEMNNPEADLPDDLIHPNVMERYYQYYFYNRAYEMSYPVDVERNDNLLNLLSINSYSVSEYNRINDREPKLFFRQAFATAGEQFNAIDAPVQGIIVPYSGNGNKIVADLFSEFALEQQYELLRKAQNYTVNAFPDVIKKLKEQKAIREVPEIGVLVLTDPRLYHPEFGLVTDIITDYETLIK